MYALFDIPGAMILHVRLDPLIAITAARFTVYHVPSPPPHFPFPISHLHYLQAP